MKKILIPVVVAGLSLFVGGVLAAGCVIRRGVNFVQSIDQSEKATRTDTQALELAAGETLEISGLNGDIQVEADAPGTGNLVATITARGETRAEADQRLANTKIIVERTSGGMRVRMEPEKEEVRKGGIQMTITPRCDLKLRVPKDVKLAFDISSGDIATRGPIGPSRLNSHYGDLRVAEANGNLTLSTSSGDISVESVTSAQELDARSSYGEVTAKQIGADKIMLHSSSGDVSLLDGQCKSAELVSKYGDVSATRVAGSLDARTSSGKVVADTIGGTEASLSSGYGDVVLKNFSGSAKVESSSGNVQCSGLGGSCNGRSGYGEVKISGVLREVQAESKSGAVRVEALPGSVPDRDWSIKSGYGDVSLALPRDLGFELSAKTNYGSLDVQVPLLLEAGALKDKRAVQGKVSGGGKLMSISTSSGDVLVTHQTQPR